MWTSKTERFGFSEIVVLEDLSADQLIPTLLASDPLVALRALAEIMLNGDEAKLDAVLANPRIHTRWASYASDPDFDERYHGYARRLRERQS